MSTISSPDALAASPSPSPVRVPARAPARVLGLPPRVAYGIALLAALGAAAALRWPRFARPLGAIALGLALFWLRWRFLRIEGVAGMPLSRTSRALLRKTKVN